ncbi:hypothetical protein C5167_019985 [Papaver somniferum]|uniref:beta-ketoacyl-[acyl-carrier-protein] synthase I n=1 Tax=Papaver somniferum TaxID=3469 RepID=A0A4Y7IVM6_PAPSO|nr:hypothetical protein C5167_019985 [Papaver somniferum]
MNELDKTRCGILVGSGMGGTRILLMHDKFCFEQVFNDAIEALRISYKKMNPFCVPFASTNMGPAVLAINLGWIGPNYSISTSCATSNFCNLNAVNHIIRGEADVVLRGVSDSVIIPLGGFVACRALSKGTRIQPKLQALGILLVSHISSQNRDGFVMGEEAGVLLFEELDHAKAEFLGGSFTSDDRASSRLSICQCLMTYWLLQLRVNSTKCMISHLLGAAGAVEIHLSTSFLSYKLDKDAGWPEERETWHKGGISNSFGIGGHNSSILLSPY